MHFAAVKDKCGATRGELLQVVERALVYGGVQGLRVGRGVGALGGVLKGREGSGRRGAVAQCERRECVCVMRQASLRER